MSYDPLSQYVYNQTGIPQSYVQAMEGLGFLGRPFGGAEQNFQAIQQYQQVMKSMMDRLAGGYLNNGNFQNMPFNVRNMFNAAAPILTDPMYAGLSNPNFFKNGYQMGAFPNDPSWWYGGWKEQTSGFPNFPPPTGISAFGSPNGYNPSALNANNPLGPNGQPLTPQQQNPNTGQNAGPGGQYAAQRQQQADIGTHSATDSSGNTYTVNKSYGDMTPQEKDDANRYAHNMAG